jgi:hypothetical protein
MNIVFTTPNFADFPCPRLEGRQCGCTAYCGKYLGMKNNVTVAAAHALQGEPSELSDAEKLGYELQGVIIDVEQGHGFDATCLETIKRVRDALSRRTVPQNHSELSDAEIYSNWCKTLVTALKRLSFAAQTTGGTAGPDSELMAAIVQAEEAMSMKSTASALSRRTVPDAVKRNYVGIGELERSGYIPAGSAAEREATVPDAAPELLSEAPVAWLVEAQSVFADMTGHRKVVYGAPPDAGPNVKVTPLYAAPDQDKRDAARYRFIKDVPHTLEVHDVLAYQLNSIMDDVIDAAMQSGEKK